MNREPSKKYLPVVGAAAAGSLARELHREASALDVERAAHARKEDMLIACKPGCNACCRPAVTVYEPEAIAVAQWLLRPANSEALAAFQRAYPLWRRQLGADIDRMMELDEANDTVASQAVYESMTAKNVMCAFDRDGWCTIYRVRPNVCRAFVALDTSDNCQVDAPRGPTMMGYLPYDEFMERALPRLREAHAELRTSKPEPLCDSVHRLLADPAALAEAPRQKLGRNDPCPCGSGHKYKRCCWR